MTIHMWLTAQAFGLLTGKISQSREAQVLVSREVCSLPNVRSRRQSFGLWCDAKLLLPAAC